MGLTAMEKEYHFKEVERRWYELWEKSGCFRRSENPKGKSYAIVIPPPNVTGVLHMGHLLNNTLQDVLIRRARQNGHCVFWQPGTDHAGISLQVVVEKKLLKEGIDPKKLSREEFLAHACRWRDEHGGIILDQLRHLGVSCDFSKKVHTLDTAYSRTVLTGFVELFKRGLIYRGRRMVNWCPKSQTALSDEEVLMQTRKGKLYRMRYEIVETPGTFIEISTTRPETIPGDVAVAVHPEDPRYQHLIGKHARRPFPGAEIPIIGDSSVLRDFGTGALKITPAHDAVDFAIGQRHGLTIIDVITLDGRLNELAGPELRGLTREAAREKAVQMLQERGLLLAAEDYEHSVGISERSGVPIEPRLSEQWFLRYPCIERAKEAVQSGTIQFFPRRWEKTYLHWLDNIQDWCISRQLLWGHRIPVWYRRSCDRQDPANWHVSVDGPADVENWEQDNDVLDTWFSSAFWPLGTLGWPDQEAMARHHFDFFYPTATLVTGPDIIFFWVARMIIMSLAFLEGDLAQIVPFRAVYFTGIIRDAQGRKMSKSLGNSPEPLDLIAQYGADGVRFGLLSIAPQGQDVLFDGVRMEQGRNLCTKLWNACRFRILQGKLEKPHTPNLGSMAAEDEAILQSLIDLTEQLEFAFGQYEFHGAVQRLEKFFRDDYCDWYVEVCKIRMRQEESQRAHILTLQDTILRHYLQLLQPFVPFIAQELWHALGYDDEEKFIQNFPLQTAEQLRRITPVLSENIVMVAELRAAVSAIRAHKSSLGMASQTRLHAYYYSENREAAIEKYLPILCALCGFEKLIAVDSLQGRPATLTPWGTFAVDVPDIIDHDRERERLSKEIEALERGIASNEAKLNNKDFLAHAPEKVIAGAKALLAENRGKLGKLRKFIGSLK
ncbi:MAG: valine--tRNA ligase [Puniceicoccales bacterium]|jgi:valyl-tRNA synthetase|nr:valine--tRNA ligase [Puniceicoccales bacterium]